jgi:hypothetical protein
MTTHSYVRPLAAAIAAVVISVLPLPTSAEPAAVGVAGVELAQRSGDVHVRGYTRKDGTYVQPHWRSRPDGNPSNNYSFPGNTNPYTGKVAPGNPSTYGRGSSATVESSPRDEMRPGETRIRPDGSIYVAPIPEVGR